MPMSSRARHRPEFRIHFLVRIARLFQIPEKNSRASNVGSDKSSDGWIIDRPIMRSDRVSQLRNTGPPSFRSTRPVESARRA